MVQNEACQRMNKACAWSGPHFSGSSRMRNVHSADWHQAAQIGARSSSYSAHHPNQGLKRQASKGHPWTSSTAEAVVGLERRNAHGIQSVDGGRWGIRRGEKILSPDTTFATEALNRIPFKCYFNPTINMSHVHGVDQEVVILPVRARDEEQQGTTQESMFNFVRLSDGGINRFPQLRSEVDLICHLGEHLIAAELLDFSVFRNHERVRQWIGDVVPGFAKLSEIDASKEEFHIEGRTLHTPAFATLSAKASFYAHPLPLREQRFYLTSVRSEGQFNSIIYHEYDTYRDQQERWVVLMNPQDMAQKGWQPGQKVNVVSATGKMSGVKVKPFDIRRGNVMAYYPEANILVGKHVDPHSKTPGFKSVPVSLELFAG